MKVWVGDDERYPDYYVSEKPSYGAHEADLSEADLADLRRVQDEYDEWQRRLSDIFRASKPSKPTEDDRGLIEHYQRMLDGLKIRQSDEAN